MRKSRVLGWGWA